MNNQAQLANIDAARYDTEKMARLQAENAELKRELEEARRDAERWRAFRARDELPDLNYEHFCEQFREDADSIIDSARQQKGQ